MDELDELAALHADERVWLHRPDGRHVSVAYSRAKVAEMEQQWSRDGLGYWVARLGQPIAGGSADTFVGVGGCAVEASGDWWTCTTDCDPNCTGTVLLPRSAMPR